MEVSIWSAVYGGGHHPREHCERIRELLALMENIVIVAVMLSLNITC